MVFVVYTVAGAFKDSAGQLHDNYPLLSEKFRSAEPLYGQALLGRKLPVALVLSVKPYGLGDHG
jgi:hypothetical protein